MITRQRLEEIRINYNAAKIGQSYISASKRIHVKESDFLSDWYVGFGKDESCQIEGTQNHWRWLALILLGLADRKDAPYSEDKEPPDIIQELIDSLKVLMVAAGL